MAKRQNALTMVREPNGRLSRSTLNAIDGVAPSEARRLRDAALLGMRDPEWGSEPGRLFLAGKIGPALYEAAKRWARMATASRRTILAPREAPAASTFVPRVGGQPPDPDSETGKKIAAKERMIAQEFAEASGVLLGAGPSAVRVVRMVCEYDRPVAGYVELIALQNGLLWLSNHWGLTNSCKNVRRA